MEDVERQMSVADPVDIYDRREEAVARVLGLHRWQRDGDGFCCDGCDWTGDILDFDAHVATALVAAADEYDYDTIAGLRADKERLVGELLAAHWERDAALARVSELEAALRECVLVLSSLRSFAIAAPTNEASAAARDSALHQARQAEAQARSLLGG